MSITLVVWTSQQTPGCIITLDGEIPFEDAPTVQDQWIETKKIRMISPLVRPIPDGYDIYIAKRQQSYPYLTSSIYRPRDIFNTSDRGVYFIATPKQVDNLLKMCSVGWDDIRFTFSSPQFYHA